MSVIGHGKRLIGDVEVCIHYYTRREDCFILSHSAEIADIAGQLAREQVLSLQTLLLDSCTHYVWYVLSIEVATTLYTGLLSIEC